MNRTLGVKCKVTFFASFKSNRHHFFIQMCPLKSYSKRKEWFNGCEEDVFGRSRSLRWVLGRVKGVRDGSEVREDRTRWLVQEIGKTTEKQKSFIAPK